MDSAKIVFQRRPNRPHTVRKSFRTHTPASMTNHSRKFFSVNAQTPTAYRLTPHSNALTPLGLENVQPKLVRMSYLPNSTRYNKLNAKLTLHKLEFMIDKQREVRLDYKIKSRRAIDFTSSNLPAKNFEPLEARGSSISTAQ